LPRRQPVAIPEAATGGGRRTPAAIPQQAAAVGGDATGGARPAGAQDARPWYHPELDRAKAEHYLRGRAVEGDFLVRGSSQANAVALSMYCRAKLRNYLLTKTPAGYIIDGKPLGKRCDTLDEVVTYLRRHNDGTAGLLVSACPVGSGAGHR